MKRFKTSVGSSADSFYTGRKLEIEELILPNGLQCFLYKDDTNPIVNVTLGYKVGSKDEDKGKRGLAHFFEHMMFQGSENVKKNEHFHYIMKSGGTCNAFTMHDATIYYEMIPSQNLEMALWLESDRMNSLNISEQNMQNQKNVILEEKKQVNENVPYGSTINNVFRNVFHGSGYESSVIGETEDISSFTVDEAKSFHNKYYTPRNAVLNVSGNIDYKVTERLIGRYFGDISKDAGIERQRNEIKAISEDQDLEVYDNVQLSALNICFQIPGAGAIENYAAEYLVEIIANSRSSRLYRKLVYEKQLAKSVSVSKYNLEDSGVLIMRAIVNPGVSIDLIKKEILDTLREVGEKGIRDDEFRKIKNQIEFANTLKYQKIQNISLETVFNYMYFEDVSRINSDIHNYLAVTIQDVINFTNDFIINKNKLILKYLPKY